MIIKFLVEQVLQIKYFSCITYSQTDTGSKLDNCVLSSTIKFPMVSRLSSNKVIGPAFALAFCVLAAPSKKINAKIFYRSS